MSMRFVWSLSGFQSTLLMRGATSSVSESDTCHAISIHAPHARSDQLTNPLDSVPNLFQSTLLMRGATSSKSSSPGLEIFQSTLLMRGATYDGNLLMLIVKISIHAPHARSDRSPAGRGPCICRDFNPRSSCEERPADGASANIAEANFNPRSSCEERHADRQGDTVTECAFQSTLLMRGATRYIGNKGDTYIYFNPRSSCEERLSAINPYVARLYDFNPRSSCEERLAAALAVFPAVSGFQSTLLMRGATNWYRQHK